MTGYQRVQSLPLQEQYKAGAKKRIVEASGEPDIGKAGRERGLDQFETLAFAMGRFADESDAWRDFTADCEERLTVTPRGGPTSTVVPADIWDYWASVAAGTNPDYNQSGKRTDGQ
jgi:hypothetical protein